MESFGKALEWLWDVDPSTSTGNWVRRASWPDGYCIHIDLPNRNARFHRPYLEFWDGLMLGPWAAGHEDLLAEDWELTQRPVFP